MYNVGDLVIYSGHGICKIDEICERTYFGETKSYYILHPLDDTNLTLSNPVNNKSGVLQNIIESAEAEEILESFKLGGTKWIEKSNQRYQAYAKIVTAGERLEVAKIINTLMRKKLEVESNDKKFSENDSRLLTSCQNNLFKELAISMDTTFEDILERASDFISIAE